MDIQALLAREAIRHLMACYNMAGDTGRRDAFAALFTDDAQLTAPGLDLRTREGIVAGLFAPPPPDAPAFKVYRHNLTTCKIDLTGPDTAKGRTYFLVVTDAGLDHSGVYSDDFRCEAGVWKFARRQVRVDYVAPTSLQFKTLSQR